jgi:hypothetical protein
MQNLDLLQKVNLYLINSFGRKKGKVEGGGYLEQSSLIRYVTAKRGPLRHEDCYWDYGKARCSWPEYCEYRLFLFLSDNSFSVGTHVFYFLLSMFYVYFIYLFIFT